MTGQQRPVDKLEVEIGETMGPTGMFRSSPVVLVPVESVKNTDSWMNDDGRVVWTVGGVRVLD